MSNATGTTRKSLKKQTRPPAYASDKPGGRNRQTSIPKQTNGNNAKFHQDEIQIRYRQNPNTIGTVFSNKSERCFSSLTSTHKKN